MIILDINSIGYNNRQSEFYSFSQPAGSEFLTLYIFKTPAVIILESNINIGVPANSFIFIERAAPYEIHAAADGLIMDWIEIGTRDSQELLVSYNICSNKLYKLPACNKTDSVLEIIMYEYYRLNPNKEEIIKNSVNTLMLILSDQTKTEYKNIDSPYYEQLVEMRKKIHSCPSRKWTIDELCRDINLSRSYFQLLYRETFGITCINDVIEYKINLAKKSLADTRNTVSAIAQMCGYDSDVHFMRQFKKITGMTPSEYRKQITGSEKK